MSRKKNPLRRIRLVLRRTSPLVKCVVFVTIVLSAVALFTLRGAIRREQAQQEQLRLQAAQELQQKRELTKRIAELGTVESVKRIAELELGLVDPNTEFFIP